MSEIPKNPYRKFWMNQKGEVFQNLLPGGEPLLAASACLLPSAQESRNSILRIRREFKISRAQLAICLGVGKHTLRRWETGERSPSRAGRRLIQLVHQLYFGGDGFAFDFGAMMAGKIDLGALEKVKKSLSCSAAKSFMERIERTRNALRT